MGRAGWLVRDLRKDLIQRRVCKARHGPDTGSGIISRSAEPLIHNRGGLIVKPVSTAVKLEPLQVSNRWVREEHVDLT